MYKKRFSQKVARLFEVVGYLMLIPALIGLICSLVLLFLSFFLSLIIFLIVGFGIILFVGYCRHSRNLLDQEKILPLWIGTFLFNALLFVFGVYHLLEFIKRMVESDESLLSFPFVLFNLIVAWWLAVLTLSANAAVKEFNSN